MPWKVSTLMSVKREFLESCLRHESSISSLCRAYGISRNTAYRLLKRHETEGVEALIDGRTLRVSRERRYGDDIWQEVSKLRQAYPSYGPRKLVHILRRQFPDSEWPSVSLVKKYLHDSGLSTPRILRRTIVSERLPLREFAGPNSVWCMDFKGYFISKDEKRCDTFTLIDGSSRYFLACTPLRPMRFAQVRPVLERIFEEYGLPEAIRSDNAPPFGSNGFRGLSPLSVWLLKNEIWPEKITPGRPGENGRLERAHRSLQSDVLERGKYNYAEYESLFAKFIQDYNTVRPHEALDYKTPAQVYRPSPRKYTPDRKSSYSYPPDYTVTKITSKGYLQAGNARIYLTESLSNEYVGIGPETESGHPLLFLGYPLGYLEEHYARLRKRQG